MKKRENEGRAVSDKDGKNQSKKQKVKMKGESNLNHFFRPTPTVPATPLTPLATWTTLTLDDSSDEDADAVYARSLAKEDGISLAQLKQAEVKWKGKSKVGIKEIRDDKHKTEQKQPRTSAAASTSKLPSPNDVDVKIESKQSTIASTSSLVTSPIKPSASAKGGAFFLSPTRSIAVPSSPDQSLDASIYHFVPATALSTPWPSSRIPFSYLSAAFVAISSTKSRLAIVQILTNLLRVVIELDPDSLLPVVWLITSRLGPSYDSEELGIGSNVLGKAIGGVSGLSSAALRTLWKKLGDAGDVAYEATKPVRLLMAPAPLVVHSLYGVLVGMTKMKGTGSQATKTDRTKKLLVATIGRGEEARFLIRILIQNLRIGAVNTTLTVALARAFALSRRSTWDHGNGQDGEYLITEVERTHMMASTEVGTITKKGKAKSKANVDVDEIVIRVREKLSRAEAMVRKVFVRHPDYSHIVPALLDTGIGSLEVEVPLAIGTPLQPMLGAITRSLDEVYTRLSDRPFVAEVKLDGQRGQIHVSLVEPRDAGKGVWSESETTGRRIWVRLFSRNLEDMTDKYPDIVSTLSLLLDREMGTITSFIVDSEIVAIDPITSEFKSFQELSYRSKKEVALEEVKIRVGVYAFDLMFLNDESLLHLPFRQRRDLLRSKFQSLKPDDIRLAIWDLIPSSEDNAPPALQSFFHEALTMRAEGIMVKLLDEAEVDLTDSEESTPAPSTLTSSLRSSSRKKILPSTYEPDLRSSAWLKVKADYLEGGIGDSLDVVPIGAWHGSGRKNAFWSPILLAVFDKEDQTFVALTKVMSGFSDEFYKDLNQRFAPNTATTSSAPFPSVDVGPLHCDIYFAPIEVWEIVAADLTSSPVYPAAQSIMGGERGISMRFPRFLKRRDDKNPEQATSAEELAEIYWRQFEKGGKGKGKGKQRDVEAEQEQMF